MQVEQNLSLKRYNTFGINAHAKYFASFSNVDELKEVLVNFRGHSKLPMLVLGGGSNILFTKDFDGMVLKNDIKGIETVHEDNDHVFIKTGAGENWHSFVRHCINNDLAGVENLSLIPGNVGASPMQNIGAYGAEIRDVFHSLEALHISDGRVVSFTANDCEFGYRESVFKNKYRDQFVILNVTYRLNRKPVLNISYGSIREELDKMKVKELNIRAVSQAVINIRSSKLPDPAVTGNAGSFFKNPEISKDQFDSIKSEYPAVVGYESGSGKIKLAAAWLIEQCGWKGYRKGDAGCHAKQALVLVNYGNASGAEIYDLSEEIKQSVKMKFNVDLVREVNII